MAEELNLALAKIRGNSGKSTSQVSQDDRSCPRSTITDYTSQPDLPGPLLLGLATVQRRWSTSTDTYFTDGGTIAHFEDRSTAQWEEADLVLAPMGQIGRQKSCALDCGDEREVQ